MNMDYELFSAVANKRFWEDKDVQFLQLRTADIFHSPTQENLAQGVQFMKKIANEGNTVYVHCKAGRTRSATLVGCYLIDVSKLFSSSFMTHRLIRITTELMANLFLYFLSLLIFQETQIHT